VLACGNFGEIEVFPTRKAVDTSSAFVTKMESQKSWLGQNIPNPASHSVGIPYFIEKDAAHGLLEIYELATGRSIKSYQILTNGSGLLEINVSNLAASLYGYRLVVDGKAKDWKKMAITK